MRVKKLLGILIIIIFALLSLTGCQLNRDFNNDSTDSLVNGGGDSDSGSGDSGSGDSGNETPQVSTYTITFESNGGSSVGSISVDSNTTLTNLETPTKDGYIFDGWYTNASLSTMFDTTSKITANMTLYAKWTEIKFGDIIEFVSGYNEGLYVIFDETNTLSTVLKVEVKKSDELSYNLVDSELIRKENDENARVDIVGLAAGSYDVKIMNSKGVTQIKNDILVTSYDRSGYAHFGASEGVGAYNNDGTLKDNATVVYVNDSNKNTVSATIDGNTYTGIVNILNASTPSNPVDIRIIGKVSTTQFNKIEYTSENMTQALIDEQMASLGGITDSIISSQTIIDLGYNSYSDDIAEGITQIEGLSSWVLYWNGAAHGDYSNAYDSYWNMCIVAASNLTVEGIGSDAELFQWGIEFRRSSSIEVRNLTFSDYPEDAIGFAGDNILEYSRFWLHNSTFNTGVNNWDLTDVQNKGDGDGSTDIKRVSNVTVSYVRYNKTHKTSLIFSDSHNENYAKNITVHHNYYDQCISGLPLIKHTNVHIYNNYYYKCKNAQDVRNNAFVYSEYNYFEDCAHPQKNTDTYLNTTIKSYNDFMDNNTYDSDATIVTQRDALIDSNWSEQLFYINFDTNSDLFYYDSINNKSNVAYLQTNKDIIKSDAQSYAGVISNINNIIKG